jgi:hypothetical protein
MTKITITFVGPTTRSYDVEDAVANELLAEGHKLSETRMFKDTKYQRHTIMMANVLMIEEVFPTRTF